MGDAFPSFWVPIRRPLRRCWAALFPETGEDHHMQSNRRKLLLTLIVLGALGSVAGWATFSAFSATTSNTGNSFAAGTVAISDNDAGSAMYSVSNQKPGDSTVACIKVTYTGSLDATVKIYASSIPAFGQYVNLLVETGTGSPTFPGCTGFVADAAPTLYSGTLKAFADTYTSFANGLADNPGAAATKWITNDAVVYRFTLTLQDNNSANGGTTGVHSFTWEAQNQ